MDCLRRFDLSKAYEEIIIWNVRLLISEFCRPNKMITYSWHDVNEIKTGGN